MNERGHSRIYYTYDFNFTVNVNSDWFSQITWKVNDSTVEGKTSMDFTNAQQEAEDIKNALLSLQQQVQENGGYSVQPQQAVVCPYCGATTIPDANGCCEYCGSALGGIEQ